MVMEKNGPGIVGSWINF